MNKKSIMALIIVIIFVLGFVITGCGMVELAEGVKSPGARGYGSGGGGGGGGGAAPAPGGPGGPGGGDAPAPGGPSGGGNG